MRLRNRHNTPTAGHFVDVTELLLLLVNVVLVIVAIAGGNDLKLGRWAVERLAKAMEMIHLLQREVIILADLVNRMALLQVMILLEALFTVFPLKLTHHGDLFTLVRLVLFNGDNHGTTHTGTGHHRKGWR